MLDRRQGTNFVLVCYGNGILDSLVPETGEAVSIATSSLTSPLSPRFREFATAVCQLSSSDVMLGGMVIDSSDARNEALFRAVVHLVVSVDSSSPPAFRRFALKGLRRVLCSTHIPGSEFVAIGSDATRLLLWYPETQEEILLNQEDHEKMDSDLKGKGRYSHLLHHPIAASTSLFCGHSPMNRCELWDLEVSKLAASVPQPSRISSLALDPFRNQLIFGLGTAGSRSSVELYDSRSLELTSSICNQGFGEIEQLIFREESRNQIVVGGYDSTDSTINLHVCDVRFMNEILLSWETWHVADITQLVDVPDHDLIVSFGELDGGVSAWRATDGKEMWTHHEDFDDGDRFDVGIVAVIPFLQGYEEFVGTRRLVIEKEDEDERIGFVMDQAMGLVATMEILCGVSVDETKRLACTKAFVFQ